mmetsp:Transcript_85331/g.217456  ORF Transcript_85331/g.217456 Transcript_85331/m.217456 type:complete len:350 (-) Transcript_85331:988-2037(-)
MEVQDGEESVCLLACHADGVEDVLHVWSLQHTAELLDCNDPVAVHVRGLEALQDLLQQLSAVCILHLAARRLNENTGHEVHDHQDPENNVAAEQHGQKRADVAREGLYEVRPIDAARRCPEEIKKRAAEGPVIPRELGYVVGLPQTLRDKLCANDAHHVRHHHKQEQGPHEGPKRADDEVPDLVQFTHEMHHPEHPNNAGRPQHAQEVHCFHGNRQTSSGVGQRVDDLNKLCKDHDQVENVPAPLGCAEEAQKALGEEPQAQLSGKHNEEYQFHDAEMQRNLVGHEIGRLIVHLHTNCDRVNKKHHADGVVERRVAHNAADAVASLLVSHGRIPEHDAPRLQARKTSKR